MAKMNEYTKVTIFLICVVTLKVAFAFLGGRYADVSLRDFFTSVLNTQNIVSLTNEARTGAGLGELKIDYKLRIAAQRKAEDMLKNQYFEHESPTGKLAWDFMDEAGYAYLFGGENLAMNFSSAEDVTAGWLASVTHKANIMNETYTQIGIGIVSGKFFGKDTTIVVQMFGRPLRASAQKTILAAKARKLKKSNVIKAAQTVGLKSPTQLDEYISTLVKNNVAEWLPAAKARQIFTGVENNSSEKKLLDRFFSYSVVSAVSVYLWRFYRRKQYRNIRLSAYTFIVLCISLLMSVF